MPAPIRAIDAARQPRSTRSTTVLPLPLSKKEMPLRSSLFGLPAVWMDPPRDTDTDQVETQHGDGVDTHRPRIGAGRDDGRNQKNREDGVANVLPKEFRTDDTEQREEEDEDRHLKADAKAQDDGEEEARVLLDRDHGVELAAKSHDKDLERA